MSESSENEWVTGTVKLSLYGEPVEIQMTVPARPVKLTRMLPVLQQMTNSFLEVGVNKIRAEGKEVSCAKGCGACCRQLVPVSEAETLLISELVENFPEPRRSEIKRRFADACRHFYEIKWFERLDNSGNLSDAERQKLSEAYFQEGVPCPFLEEESCSIHENRPLVCREYLVASPAENCRRPSPENIDRVKLLFLISDVVKTMEDENNAKRQNFVPLICSLAFAEQNSDKLVEKTGVEWMTQFFQELSKTAGQQV